MNNLTSGHLAPSTVNIPALRALWSRRLAPQSVKARVTLLALVIGLASTIVSGLYISRLLRVDLERVLAAQQLAASRSVAESIDRDLKDRLVALERVAALAAQIEGQTPERLQRLLEGQPVFQDHFNGGTFITDVEGVSQASTLNSAKRIGVSYAEKEWFQQVIETRRSVIGTPSIGKVMGVAGLVMAAPIRDASGRVVGALAGVINLQAPSFLDVNRPGYRGGPLV